MFMSDGVGSPIGRTLCDVNLPSVKSHILKIKPKQDMTTIKEYVTAGATDPPEKLEKKEKLIVRMVFVVMHTLLF